MHYNSQNNVAYIAYVEYRLLMAYNTALKSMLKLCVCTQQLGNTIIQYLQALHTLFGKSLNLTLTSNVRDIGLSSHKSQG